MQFIRCNNNNKKINKNGEDVPKYIWGIEDYWKSKIIFLDKTEIKNHIKQKHNKNNCPFKNRQKQQRMDKNTQVKATNQASLNV